MTLNEKEARQMALKLALDYPSGGVITNPNPNAVEERAERFRRYLMGETPPPTDKERYPFMQESEAA
jgi:hypothetical protein